MLVSAIVSLSTDVIKLTDTWIAGKGSVFVLALAMLTYMVLALLDGIRSNQHRDRVIGCCLGARHWMSRARPAATAADRSP